MTLDKFIKIKRRCYKCGAILEGITQFKYKGKIYCRNCIRKVANIREKENEE